MSALPFGETTGLSPKILSRATSNFFTGTITGATFGLTLEGSGNGSVASIIGTTSGTVTKSGTGVWTLSGANTFTGGTILNAGTLNINNSTALGTVAGTFTINGGTINNTSAGNITTLNYPLTLNNDFIYSGSVPRNLNLGTGAVTLSANRQITVSAGILTIGGTINDNTKNLTKAGGGTLSFGSNAVTLNGLTISSGTLISTSGTMNLAGDLSNSGTFTHNSGTVTFNGTAAQSIGGAVSSTFNNITVNNSSNVTLTKAQLADGVLTFTNGLITTTATNLLTLNAGSSVSGAGTGKYINGPAKKIGNTAFTFPVGKSTVYAPLTISAPSLASDAFTAEYLRISGTALGSITAPGLSQVSNCEYWGLDRTTGTSTVDVTLSWSSSSPCNVAAYITDLPTLTVAHFNGSNWDTHGSNGTTGTVSAGTVTRNSVSVFSPFTLGSTSATTNPLPVKFNFIKAFEKNQAIQIDWSILTEINVGHYEVERSSNGQQFTTVGQQQASRNNSDKANYSWLDISPGSGIVFYRIKAVDLDGKKTYSTIIRINMNSVVHDITLFPNPIIDKRLSFELGKMDAGKYDIVISDRNGSIVYSSSFNHYGGSISQSIALPPTVATGIYNLRIINNDKSMMKSFVIK